MAVTPDSLLDPDGPVTPKLFPREGVIKLRARLAAYIATAASDPRIVDGDPTKADAMVRAYVLMTVYRAVVDRLSAEPMTVTVAEKGGHGYTATQINNMKERAAQYAAELDALTVTTGVIHFGQFPGTMSVETERPHDHRPWRFPGCR